MPSPEGYTPSPVEMRAAESSMADRQRELTEMREDTLFEGRNQGGELSGVEESIVKYEVKVGERVDSVTEEIIALANRSNQTVRAEFNGAGLIAKPGDSADSVIKNWEQELDRSAEEYRNSPEGKRRTVEAEQKKAEKQSTVDRLMEELPKLDFNELAIVIDWLDSLSDPSDYIGVNVPRDAIMSTFKNHGFEASVNLGDEYDGNDRENFARYLIGQGLAGLETRGSIHPVFNSIANTWREKFNS